MICRSSGLAQLDARLADEAPTTSFFFFYFFCPDLPDSTESAGEEKLTGKHTKAAQTADV